MLLCPTTGLVYLVHSSRATVTISNLGGGGLDIINATNYDGSLDLSFQGVSAF